MTHKIDINTAQEFDGSDSGARPDEAVSWGKIKTTANPVKVYHIFTFCWLLSDSI
jgi:deoxyhypusine synthase